MVTLWVINITPIPLILDWTIYFNTTLLPSPQVQKSVHLGSAPERQSKLHALLPRPDVRHLTMCPRPDPGPEVLSDLFNSSFVILLAVRRQNNMNGPNFFLGSLPRKKFLVYSLRGASPSPGRPLRCPNRALLSEKLPRQVFLRIHKRLGSVYGRRKVS